jgi:nucleoid-associated protein YgaU
VNLPAGARSYTVVQGDNLYSISRKMYGVTTRITDIQKANVDKLGSGPNPSLKIGMILIIPK